MRARAAAWCGKVLGWDRRRAPRAAPVDAVAPFLVITPHVEFIRVFDQPDGYAKRLPYIGIMCVTHLTGTDTYLHGAHGKITRATYNKALDLLRARGIRTLWVERHGKLKTISLDKE